MIGILIGAVVGLLIGFSIVTRHERTERRARQLHRSGRLGLPAPKPSTEPTAGEVVLWMIDPSRSDPRRGGK